MRAARSKTLAVAAGMLRGSGRAIAIHTSFGSRVGMVAEVTVARAGPEVDRIVAAVDRGIAINPDGIAAQVEGAVGFALPAVLRNRVTLKDGIVEQGNFDADEPARRRSLPYELSGTA